MLGQSDILFRMEGDFESQKRREQNMFNFDLSQKSSSLNSPSSPLSPSKELPQAVIGKYGILTDSEQIHDKLYKELTEYLKNRKLQSTSYHNIHHEIEKENDSLMTRRLSKSLDNMADITAIRKILEKTMQKRLNPNTVSNQDEADALRTIDSVLEEEEKKDLLIMSPIHSTNTKSISRNNSTNDRVSSTSSSSDESDTSPKSKQGIVLSQTTRLNSFLEDAKTVQMKHKFYQNKNTKFFQEDSPEKSKTYTHQLKPDISFSSSSSSSSTQTSDEFDSIRKTERRNVNTFQKSPSFEEQRQKKLIANKEFFVNNKFVARHQKNDFHVSNSQQNSPNFRNRYSQNTKLLPSSHSEIYLRHNYRNKYYQPTNSIIGRSKSFTQEDRVQHVPVVWRRSPGNSRSWISSEENLSSSANIKLIVKNCHVDKTRSGKIWMGTPIIQQIRDGVLPTAHGDGLHKGEQHKPAVFIVDSAGLKGDLFVQVDGPNSIAKCNIHPESNGTYTVTYIPVETGFYDIIIKWNDREIQGSPFHAKIVDARQVRVTGGWQHYMDSNERVHLVVNEEKRIPFDVSEAGPGKLTAEIKDPYNTKVPVHIETSSDGKNTLLFTPKVEGDHHINVYWSEHPLLGAPFLGHAVSKQVAQVPDSSKIVLAGKGLKEAIVREEAEFRIDGSKAGPGKPAVNLTGVRTDIDVEVVPQGNNCYRCKYMPVIPGAYLLNITWNERQLKGSPYKVTIIAAPQPQKVMVTGDGLQGGIIGKDLQMNIDTRKAGLGELTAHCVGPNNVAYCELVDNHDGIYKLTVRPQEAGRHVLQIKYGGENVLSSPYVLKIGSLPDASKVRVSGPGVEHGILATYQSKFLVETRGAGAGQLSVRIKGPKGAFQVEMYRDNQKDRNIICCYNPYETGLYIIQIKWSGVDVPGSPFQVHIVDTQQEYESIMQSTAAYQQNGYGFADSSSQRHSFNHWRDDI